MASKYDNGVGRIVKNGRSRSSKYYDKNPASKKKKGAYDRAYNSRPEQIKRRDSRNKARKEMGNPKGKDIHHKDNNPLNNSKSNLEVMSVKKNRQAALRKDAPKRTERTKFVDKPKKGFQKSIPLNKQSRQKALKKAYGVK
jgi:hypothetical protein